MPMLELTDQEWQTLTLILADVPWKISNPILFKMANQVREQRGMPAPEQVDLPPPLRPETWKNRSRESGS